MSPLVCVTCALQALAEGRPAPTFDESPEVHLARHANDDPDLRAATLREVERVLRDQGITPAT